MQPLTKLTDAPFYLIRLHNYSYPTNYIFTSTMFTVIKTIFLHSKHIIISWKARFLQKHPLLLAIVTIPFREFKKFLL